MDERAHAGMYLNGLHPRKITLPATNLCGGTDVGIASRTPQSQGFGTGTAHLAVSVAACAAGACRPRHGQGSPVPGCGCTELGAVHAAGSCGHHVPQQNASFSPRSRTGVGGDALQVGCEVGSVCREPAPHLMYEHPSSP